MAGGMSAGRRASTVAGGSPNQQWYRTVMLTDMSYKAKYVALACGDHVMDWQTMGFFWSVSQMARYTGLSETSVKAGLRELRERGYLYVKVRGGRRHGGTASLYQGRYPSGRSKAKRTPVVVPPFVCPECHLERPDGPLPGEVACADCVARRR